MFRASFWFLLLTFFLLCSEPLHAAEKNSTENQTSNTMLVLDGSGSMWGAIDGRHKILIARDVINDVVSQMGADIDLGLMAYGHNRKGDCDDIELLVKPGASKAQIIAAAQGVTPLGKTPLSEAVNRAATHLQYENRPATVVLVSDGEETCNLDPCKIGADLERAGVNFTAHVVGFGLADATQQSGLRCLAENTGGRYFNATDANELNAALQETVALSPSDQENSANSSEPTVATLHLIATDLTSGPSIESGLSWKITGAKNTSTVYESAEPEGALEQTSLAQGRYNIEVIRATDNATAKASVFVYGNENKTVTLALEVPLSASVRTEPAVSAPAGGTVDVHWEGPNRKHDWIGLSKPGAEPGDYLRYKYTKRGSPVTLKLPIEEGTWEIRYVIGRPARILARQTFTTTAVPTASVSSAASVVAGAALDVEWTGPDYPNDWIGLVTPGAPSTQRFSYSYTKRGSPLQIKTPMEPGTYELRYISAQGTKTLATHQFSVTSVTATLELPADTIAGSKFEVNWQGPNYRGDWIGTARTGEKPTTHTTYAYTRKGSPLRVPAPPEPGEYLVRYVSNNKILAERVITVLPVTASLSAPATAIAGSELEVVWQGPDYRSDYITLSLPQSKPKDYLSYSYTKRGSPATLTLPSEPGIYELRYVMSAGRRVIARTTIEVR